MSAVIFASGEQEFMPVPGVYAVATQLTQEGIPSLVVRHLFEMTEDDAWACCQHLARQRPVAVVVHINLPRSTTHSGLVDPAELPAIRKRLAMVKTAFGTSTQLIGTGGLFQYGGAPADELNPLLDVRVDAAYGFTDAVRRAHGRAAGVPVLESVRKRIDYWPAILASKSATIMLQPEPCFGVCGMCPKIRHCNWDDIQTWERVPQFVKDGFVEELQRNVSQYGIQHLMLADFQTDASHAKAAWLRKTMNTEGPVKFAANLVLDNLVRNPGILDELLAAGLVACNLQIGSLRADSRRAQGFVRESGRELLAKLRALSGPELWIHGNLSLGMPADRPEHAREDLAWLTSPTGRSILDSVNYVAQVVLPGSQLATQGYRFTGESVSGWGMPLWESAHMDFAQADRQALAVMAAYHGGNLIRKRYADASAILGAVNLGVDLMSIVQLHRASWGFSSGTQVVWQAKLESLEQLAIKQHALAARMGPYA